MANTNKDSGVAGRIKTALERWLTHRNHPADRPYDPQPDQNINNTNFDFEGDFSETEIDIQQLHGTSIIFGTKKAIQIDDFGRAKGLTQKPSYIIGTGRRISDIEQVGGICRFCEMMATQAFLEGKITREQAQLQSLFDINSGVQCDICGILTCSVHCRPMQTPQGQINVCFACQQEIKRQEKRRRIISLLLSPFTSSEENE